MGATLIGHRRSADVEEPRSDIAVAAVLDQLDRVLLVRQNYGRGWWALPGGEVDAGEQPADAAVREVEEETGLRVVLERLVGRYTLLRPSGRSVVSLFATASPDHPMRPDSSEIDRVGWFAGDEIPEHTNDVLRSMVGDALRGTSGIEREFRVDF